MSRDNAVLPLWTIYRRPRDFPKHYVVHRWDVNAGRQTPGEPMTADALEGARALLPPCSRPVSTIWAVRTGIRLR